MNQSYVCYEPNKQGVMEPSWVPCRLYSLGHPPLPTQCSQIITCYKVVKTTELRWNKIYMYGNIGAKTMHICQKIP